MCVLTTYDQYATAADIVLLLSFNVCNKIEDNDFKVAEIDEENAKHASILLLPFPTDSDTQIIVRVCVCVCECVPVCM